MPARFPLAAVLMLRKMKEDAEERALAKVCLAQEQLHATAERVQQQLAHWTARETQATGTVSAGAARLEHHARLGLLLRTQNDLQQQRVVLEQRRAALQEALFRARIDREMLSELQKQHEKRVRTLEDRAEQARLDDIFSAKRARG